MAESKYFGIKDGRKWTAVACSGSGHLCPLKFASGVEGHGQWSVRVTGGHGPMVGTHWAPGHIATRDHGQQVPGPRDHIGVTSVDQAVSQFR